MKRGARETCDALPVNAGLLHFRTFHRRYVARPESTRTAALLMPVNVCHQMSITPNLFRCRMANQRPSQTGNNGYWKVRRWQSCGLEGIRHRGGIRPAPVADHCLSHGFRQQTDLAAEAPNTQTKKRTSFGGWVGLKCWSQRLRAMRSLTAKVWKRLLQRGGEASWYSLHSRSVRDQRLTGPWRCGDG